MKVSVRLAAILASILLAGCGEYVARNLHMGEPARLPDESWMKHDATRLDVRKALLECGSPSTQTDRFVYEKSLRITDGDDMLSHSLLTHACMENSGFVYWRKGKFTDYCTVYREKHLPACQPGAVIPERSVERRLNSWYCKLKTDREYCRKHAFTPSACDDPKKDYSNPPPECRP